MESSLGNRLGHTWSKSLAKTNETIHLWKCKIKWCTSTASWFNKKHNKHAEEEEYLHDETYNKHKKNLHE